MGKQEVLGKGVSEEHSGALWKKHDDQGIQLQSSRELMVFLPPRTPICPGLPTAMHAPDAWRAP